MPTGSITLATGPMFSGKTEWLIEKLANSDTEKALAIRFVLDTRYSNDSLATHNGKQMNAKSAASVSDIRELFSQYKQTKTVGIDEIQFFDDELAQLLEELRQKGVTIYASGLNADYLASPWETTVAIERIADKVINLTARCNACGKNNAIYTQRIGDTTDRVAVGGIELYEARCQEHYVAIA